MSNFIPNKTIRVIPNDPPWITQNIKSMLRRQNRQYKNYKKHGFRPEDKLAVDSFRIDCENALLAAKENYLQNIGNRLADPNTSQKSYWQFINKIMNKCKAPRIPPLLINNKFITNCKIKAEEFNLYFSNQCKPIVNNSVLPHFETLTENRLSSIPINYSNILDIVRSLNPNKASGFDGISAKMLILSDESVILPLKLIFQNILATGNYPDMWKLANVTPIHKKDDKQNIKNYRPISLLPLCSKIFEKILFKHLYNFLISNNLITKNQSGFRPGDSTVNQLLYFVHKIAMSFDRYDSLETRAVFLDMSKAFDKVWHDGLIFKLKQNGISGSLVKVLSSYLTNRKQRVAVNGS